MTSPLRTMYQYASLSKQVVTFECKQKNTLYQSDFIKIQNKTKESILFKIKTTNPDIFVVKPSKGNINVGEESKIEFQINNNASVDQIIQHKFMIQILPFEQGKSAIDIEQQLKEGTKVQVEKVRIECLVDGEIIKCETTMAKSSYSQTSNNTQARYQQLQEQLAKEREERNKQFYQTQEKTPSSSSSMIFLVIGTFIGLLIGWIFKSDGTSTLNN